MKQFSVIKIICCLAIINLGVFEVSLMFKFGFKYWVNWMMVLPITDVFWIYAMVNFLIVIIGLMIWSRIEPVYVAYTPVVILALYVLFVIIVKAANLQKPFPPFGMVHLFFLAVSIIASPFAVFAINEELKYEWNTSIIGVIWAPVRLFDRLIGLDKRIQQRRQQERDAESLPGQDWRALTGGRQELPSPRESEPEQARAGSARPEKKWYEDMIERQRQRYKRK